MLPEKAEVTSDGTVIYRQLFTGLFAQRLDLRAFPFDQHRFRADFNGLLTFGCTTAFLFLVLQSIWQHPM
jgi:hypothetical protein